MTIEEINDYNRIADTLFYDKGLNILPRESNTSKKTHVTWTYYQENPLEVETHEEWKRTNRYANGIMMNPGKLFHGDYKGLYWVAIDFDKELGFKEFCKLYGDATVDELKDMFMIEQHKKDLVDGRRPDDEYDPNSLHLYFYSEVPFVDKRKDDILGIEIYSNNKHLISTTPSFHFDSQSRWKILGTDNPMLLTANDAVKLKNGINDFCKKYGVKYLNEYSNGHSNGNGHGSSNYKYNYSSTLSEELKQISRSLKIPIPIPITNANSQYIIKVGLRHDTLLAFANSLLFNHKHNNNFSDAQLKDFLFEINECLCEVKYPENDLNRIWTDALDHYSTRKVFTDNNNDNSNTNNYPSNSKASVFKHLKPEIKQQLEKHTWTPISLSPLKLLIAHHDYKQIIQASIKRYNKVVTTTNSNKNEENEDVDIINENQNETIYNLKLGTIIIRAIPVKIILNKDLLGLSDNSHKYTIEFITESNEFLTIGPKTLDEITGYLKDRALLNVSAQKAAEILGIIIGTFESDGKLIIKEDIETPGFYFIDGKIKPYHIDLPANPTVDQIKSCCDLLDILQAKFKKKDVLPTVLKWSMIAPFDYVLKQIHQKWIKWIYAYGWSNTGKSSLGEKISCCINDRYNDDKKRKESIIPFTAADTVARLGVSLSRNTYPIVINEVSQLSDEYKNKALVEMIKTTVTDEIAREKYVNKINWTRFPALSACILTSNSAPPRDIGLRRRIIPIEFTQKDQYSVDEMKELDKLFDQRMKHELKYLGNFTTHYILENQQELIIKEYKDWKIIAETILTEFYKSVGKEAPEWIKFFVEEKQLEDSKEDIDLLFRSFLINKVNEIHNKFYRNVSRDAVVSVDIPFDSRLEFCLNNKLIPFLNLTKAKDGTNCIAITTDLIHELKQKTSEISSLPEIASIIEGFEYGQKRIGVKVLRTAYGTKKNLLDFLGM